MLKRFDEASSALFTAVNENPNLTLLEVVRLICVVPSVEQAADGHIYLLLVDGTSPTFWLNVGLAPCITIEKYEYIPGLCRWLD